MAHHTLFNVTIKCIHASSALMYYNMYVFSFCFSSPLRVDPRTGEISPQRRGFTDIGQMSEVKGGQPVYNNPAGQKALGAELTKMEQQRVSVVEFVVL